MIHYQITGQNPVEMNTAAKILIEHLRLEIDTDSGNRNGRKNGYIRYIHARIKKRAIGQPRPRPARLDGADKMGLANQCWQNILHKTNTDEDAVQVIVKLIEHVERKYLWPPKSLKE